MSDPTVAMHDAVLARLKADPGVSAIAGGRVFDLVPLSGEVVFPYVTLGSFQVVDDGAACIDASEVFLDVHVWSRVRGTVQAKALSGAIRTALHEADLDLTTEFRLVDIMFRSHRGVVEPDGLTVQRVITFRALIDAAI